MKFLSVSFFIIPFLSFSQALDASNEPVIGDVSTLYVCDSNATDYASVTGSAVTWDYSAISSVNSLTNDVSVIDATTSPNAASFPASVKATNIASSIVMFFNNGTGAMSERVSQGFVFSDPGAGDFVVSFSNDDQTLMTYPFVVGDLIMDNFDGTLETALLPTGPVPASGAGVATVDGQGTLILSQNSYSNVIRYKLSDSLSATIPLVGVAQLNRTLYEYYDHTVSNLPIFVHLTTSLFSSAINVTSTLVLSKELPQTFSSLSDMENINVAIYPNPSADILTLKGDVFNSYIITNTLGMQISTGIITNSKLDISELQSGNYFLHLKSEKGTIVKSIVKK